MAAFVSQIESEDFARWKAEGRDDILHVLESESPVWVGDHLLSSRTGRPIHGCPFLTWDGDRYSCEIYETRPLVCSTFTPGSSELCPRWKK
jgi:Fe-S-cluster containining protein